MYATVPMAVPGLVRFSSALKVGAEVAPPSFVDSQLRQTKIQHLSLTVLGDENVGGLDVAMDDAFAMGYLQSRGDLYAEFQNRLNFYRPSCDQMLESAALQQFHSDKSLVFAFINFINRADIGMVESGRRTSLATEAFQALRIVRYIFRQEFQSNETAQARVFRLIHHAHSTATKLFNNSIMSDRLADHGQFG